MKRSRRRDSVSVNMRMMSSKSSLGSPHYAEEALSSLLLQVVLKPQQNTARSVYGAFWPFDVLDARHLFSYQLDLTKLIMPNVRVDNDQKIDYVWKRDRIPTSLEIPLHRREDLFKIRSS